MIDISKLLQLAQEKDNRIIRQRLDPKDFPLENMMEALTTLGKVKEPRFVIDKNNRFVYENLIKWLMRDESMMCINPIENKKMKARIEKGIYIAGSTGTGKTMAVRLLKDLCYYLGIKYKTQSETPRSLEWSDYRTDYITDEYGKGGMLDNYKNLPIVCFQDLGSESVETVYMGNRVNVMKTIIESRGDRQDRLTIFTSNYMLNDPRLVSMYGERAVSRLMDMCNYFVLPGTDRRTTAYGSK